MTRLVMWWAAFVASIVLVLAALTNKSGTCVDSAEAPASFCGSNGSGALLLVAVAACGLFLWRLTRAHRAHRR